MKKFNILDPSCPFLGPHLLEASAGTGKTFTIEHVVVRLVLENIAISEILAVTFTKASTRELKERIFINLQKALTLLESNGPFQSFDYLKAVSNPEKAKLLLSSAIGEFDNAQIFTIHGFCYRMLKEFSFEAGLLFTLKNPDNPIEDKQKIEKALHRFWQDGTDEYLCPEQLSLLFSKYDTVQNFSDFLLKSSQISEEKTFPEICMLLENKIKSISFSILDVSDLWNEFLAMSVNYKAVKGDFKKQIELLYELIQKNKIEMSFRHLLLHGGSVFDFLNPGNKKVKQKDLKNCQFAEVFDFFIQEIGPLVKIAIDRKKIAALLVSCWKVWKEKQEDTKSISDPDEILWQMRACLEDPFIQSVQNKYKAIIVDEFQDTDPLQFDIFYQCFIQNPKYQALYLVGDPKQSIYRFRNADVYTFLKAKDVLGSAHVYHLDTNFRSTKALISSLNALFDRQWLKLPKTGSNLEYHPVLSGSLDNFSPDDGKNSIHFMIGGPQSSFEDTFLPYTVEEILLLNPENLSKVAILVKDRYEAAVAQKLFLEKNIPCVCKNHQFISENFWFRSLREFLNAVIYPHDEKFVRIYEMGPFAKDFCLQKLQQTLLKGGLGSLFASVFKDSDLHGELQVVIEALLSYEAKMGFSITGYEKFMESFSKLSPEDGASMGDFSERSAVQIMTLHISKGLEFDFVFALGLSSKPPRNAEEDEEVIAEKQRQLYVAMTRAKKRLYVPFIEGVKSSSPIDLFAQNISSQEGCFKSYLEKLSQTQSISLENVETPKKITLGPYISPKEESYKPLKKFPKVNPVTIESFTSLSRFKKDLATPKVDPSDLPKGKETGIFIHEILEKIFQTKNAWKDFEKIAEIVKKHVVNTLFESFEEKIFQMIQGTMTTLISDGKQQFCLQSIEDGSLFTEFEFLYSQEDQFITGFIDLVFCFEGRIYIVDWKTSMLEDFSSSAIQEVMKSHDYYLQAKIYQEAITRYFGRQYTFGGVFYFFLRALKYEYINVQEGEL